MIVRCVWGGLLAVVFLASCGGGGGGGSEPPAPDPALSVRLGNVRVAAATQRVFEGDRLSDLTITADVTGDLARLNGQTLHVLVEDPSGLFTGTPRVMISGNGIDNRVDLPAQPTTGRVGSYRSPLRLRVCLDSACTRPIQGTPVELPLQVDVLAGLRLAEPTPVVIELPFGTTPTARSLAALLPEGMTALDWEQLQEPRLFDVKATPGLRGSVDITPIRLPVGSHSTQITLWGFATLGNALRRMSVTVPLEIRVQGVPGVGGGFYPTRLDTQTFSSAGLNSPIGGETASLVVLADGTRYTRLSRIVYLPGGNGRADAGSLEWLNVWVDTINPRPPQPIRVSAIPAACTSTDGGRTIRCLGGGRYEALVYLMTDDGREFPTPLQVSNLVSF